MTENEVTQVFKGRSVDVVAVVEIEPNVLNVYFDGTFNDAMCVTMIAINAGFEVVQLRQVWLFDDNDMQEPEWSITVADPAVNGNDLSQS